MISINISRESLLVNFQYTKYDYRNALRRHVEQILFLVSIFLSTIYYFNALYLWWLVIIFFAISVGILWFGDWNRKNDYIQLSIEGISFNQGGKSGIVPWDSIEEIISRSHESGVDCMIKTSRIVVTFNKEIEPADMPAPSFFRRFVFDYRYGKELLDQIRQMVPHVHYRHDI